MVQNPHELLYFNILEVTQRLEGNIKLALKPFGITHPQYNVLRILRGAEDMGISSKKIKERMIFTNPDITRLIDRLVSKSLALREINPYNRREILISLSPEGHKLLTVVDPIMYNAVHLFFKQDISISEAGSALETLQKMNDSLKSDHT